ncbi:aldo/keto reductase [Companilactobacillus halodurans]|uniref:Aldo/keto reductase n=1 Tax=Companilactobacillus halodurans TaxID=2584183 RepID=A0A5P0ZNA0_9LACO|nr:aldo/keto reductase [Companilactobacillus halodurans]MQS75697.1 aldo/keto reductase [Companilactobacillus halodurans]MQS97655.1 aldo/keto reductase [Companilactobacillus halodurans]
MATNIPYIELSNGVLVPQVGLGVFRMSDQEVENSVKWAIQNGYRHIDTASFYDNEEAVGRAIKDSGIDRKYLFVTTKIWNNIRGYDETIAQFNKSLEKLGLDYLDLYLIHWPAQGFEEDWRAMEDLYKAGKIRAIGVSNFKAHHIEQLMKNATIAPMVDQIETHPYLQETDLHEYLQSKNIAHESWSPLGAGLNKVIDNPVIKELADKYQKSPAQIVLRWHIQRGEIIIPKSTHEERIKENIDIFDYHFDLTPEDMNKIAELDSDQRVGADPDDTDFLDKSMTYTNQNNAK